MTTTTTTTTTTNPTHVWDRETDTIEARDALISLLHEGDRVRATFWSETTCIIDGPVSRRGNGYRETPELAVSLLGMGRYFWLLEADRIEAWIPEPVPEDDWRDDLDNVDRLGMAKHIASQHGWMGEGFATEVADSILEYLRKQHSSRA